MPEETLKNIPKTKSGRECRNYPSGRCRYGNRCSFRHSGRRSKFFKDDEQNYQSSNYRQDHSNFSRKRVEQHYYNSTNNWNEPHRPRYEPYYNEPRYSNNNNNWNHSYPSYYEPSYNAPPLPNSVPRNNASLPVVAKVEHEPEFKPKTITTIHGDKIALNNVKKQLSNSKKKNLFCNGELNLIQFRFRPRAFPLFPI